LKLLLDEMFSPLVAVELRGRGHDAVAIKERDEWQSLSDPEVIALARTERRPVVTANLRDFRPLHAGLVAPGGDGHVGMVFVPASFRLTRGATGQIVAALEVRLAEYPGDEDLADGETWINPKSGLADPRGAPGPSSAGRSRPLGDPGGDSVDERPGE
jgi:hypothetical protein